MNIENLKNTLTEIVKKHRRFYVIGSPHAGTYLIKELLNVPVSDTFVANVIIDNHRPMPSDFSVSDPVTWGFTVPDWTEVFVQYECLKSMINDGSPIIFLVRHPCSTIYEILNPSVKPCSDIRDFYDKIKIDVKNWLTDENRDFKKRYGHLLCEDNQAKLRLLSVWWLYKTDCYFSFLEKGYNVCLVKYEDMVFDNKIWELFFKQEDLSVIYEYTQDTMNKLDYRRN